jgi:hypothetical protein
VYFKKSKEKEEKKKEKNKKKKAEEEKNKVKAMIWKRCNIKINKRRCTWRKRSRKEEGE